MKQPEVKYEPYVGSGEPTKEQVLQNTLYLFETLKHLGIKCTMDNGEYAKKMWNKNEKMIVLIKGKKQFHILYNRWGFIIDGMEVDNVGLDYTIGIIKKKFK